MTIFKLSDDKGTYHFTIHYYWCGNKAQLHLGLENGDKASYFVFEYPSGIPSDQYIMSNTPNIARVFGQYDGERGLAWLEWEGGTLLDNISYYTVQDKGIYKLGKETDEFIELYFESPMLTGRWILRKISNIFNQSFIEGDTIYLLWKPVEQKSLEDAYKPEVDLVSMNCDCPIKAAENLDTSMMSSYDTVASMPVELFDTFELDGIAAAEGTWIDLFGNKYTYTSAFVETLYKRLQENLTVLTHDTEHNGVDSGEVQSVELIREPINHIRIKGKYNGDPSFRKGFSIEMRMRSYWNESFQSWVPFDATPYRVSIVQAPACKICWINKVK